MALDYAILIFRYLCVFMIFSAALRDPRLLGKMHLFFVGILVLYLLTAVWEMATWNHLPTSRMYGRNHFAPTGPFYGENILAAFMLLLLPFLMFLPKLYRKPWVKILCGGLVLLFMLVIVIQGARIAMLAATLAVLWVYLFYSSARTKTIGVVVILMAGFMFYQITPSGVKFARFMLSRELRSFGSERETVTMSSLKIRKQLFVETFDLASSTALMGVGGGNFEHYMNTDREYRTAGIINAHNWLLEILGNFGVIILMGFLYIYIKWLYMLWRLYMKSRGRERYLYLMYLMSLLLFIASSALPSSIRWNHLIWIYFAAINAVCHARQPLIEDTNA
jgi:teichuronic acid biosynthesis protein TuaE